MSNEFFPRASFPFDEDSRVRRGNLLHLVKHRFESGAITDDPLERTLGLILHKVHDGYIIFHRDL
jgi:hypothetical protein